MLQDITWSRVEQAAQVREQIWRHLSPASTPSEEVLPLASALFQLPAADLRTLRALHLLIAPETAALIDAAPGLTRDLRTSTTAVLEQHPERVRGPVDWSATFVASAAQGRRYAYATRPPERDYSTPENRLLLASLRAVVSAAQALGWPSTASGIGDQVARFSDAAAALLGAPTLRRIVPAPQVRDLRRVEQGRASRRFSPVTRFWRLREQVEVMQDPRVLRTMVERMALLPTTDGALLEVLVLIRVLDALRDRGWERSNSGLIQGKAFISHSRGGERLNVHYQGLPADLSSRYERILGQHGLIRSVLRPDLAIDRRRSDGGREVTVVEVKHRRGAADAVRAALFDLLAYRDNYGGDSATMRFAGVGWGSGLVPRERSDVLLCTPDRISDLVKIVDR